MDDNEFRIQYFEQKHCFHTYDDLKNEALKHYIVLDPRRVISGILGLDVLGNPKSLIVGVGRSVEDLFYEPFMGAVEGPSEFAGMPNNNFFSLQDCSLIYLIVDSTTTVSAFFSSDMRGAY